MRPDGDGALRALQRFRGGLQPVADVALPKERIVGVGPCSRRHADQKRHSYVAERSWFEFHCEVVYVWPEPRVPAVSVL